MSDDPALHTVTLVTEENEIRVTTDGSLTILQAMHGAGLPVRKACRNGVCGLCKCRVLAGGFTYHWKQPHGLWQRDMDRGCILPCIAHATSDIRLDEILFESEQESSNP